MLTDSMLFSMALSWTVSCPTFLMAWSSCKPFWSGQFYCTLCTSSHLPGIFSGVAATTIISTSVLWASLSACFFWDCVLHMLFETLILSNSFASVILLMTADCALCALTLFAQANTFVLMMIPFSFTFVSFLIISPNISVSFKPYMNCSFSCLSSSW